MHRHLAELNAAVLVLGLVPLFAKLIALDAVSIIGWRALIGATVLLAFVAWRRAELRLGSVREAGVLLLIGLLMAAHWSAYFHSIQTSTVAVAVVTMFTWPIMAVLIEPLIGGGRWRLQDGVLSLLSLAGVALVVPELDPASAAVQGAAWGLLAALLFAVRNVLYRRFLNRRPAGVMMGYQLVVISLCLLPFAEVPARAWDWALLLLLAVVFTAVAHSVLIASMASLRAKTVGMISCLQPVYGIAAAALLLDEHPDWHAVAGGSIVVLVAVVETVSAPAQAREATGVAGQDTRRR